MNYIKKYKNEKKIMKVKNEKYENKRGGNNNKI